MTSTDAYKTAGFFGCLYVSNPITHLNFRNLQTPKQIGMRQLCRSSQLRARLMIVRINCTMMTSSIGVSDGRANTAECHARKNATPGKALYGYLVICIVMVFLHLYI